MLSKAESANGRDEGSAEGGLSTAAEALLEAKGKGDREATNVAAMASEGTRVRWSVDFIPWVMRWNLPFISCWDLGGRYDQYHIS